VAQIMSEPTIAQGPAGTSSYSLLHTNGVRMGPVRAAIDRVAPTDATVLITGESGTGKELVARAVHERSPRCTRPFIKVNCAALPADLLESELLGYEQGAFTGAHRAKPGKFELADGGTILLDEIGDLPINLQAKLLQVLQDGEFSPLGSRQDIRVDVRVIAATNKDLDTLVATDHFRRDLYYRINVMRIDVPPLRERPEEIPFLLDYFLDRYSARYGLERLSVSDATVRIFMKYSWPGNVRELENCVKRLVVLGTEDWIPAELGRRLHGVVPDSASVPPAAPGGHLAPETNGNGHDHETVNGNGHANGNGHGNGDAGLRDISRKAALQAEALALRVVLDEVHWHRAEAAKRLKVSYRTLLSKIKQHGLEVVALCAMIGAAAS
jgi:two-component system, NtrC family, response regulator AtoC